MIHKFGPDGHCYVNGERCAPETPADAPTRLDEDGRCVMSDLYPTECGHCRGHKQPRIVRQGYAPRAGSCGRCGELFEIGDRLGVDETNARVCWRCLP